MAKKRIKRRHNPPITTPTYKARCDNHPGRRAAWAFTEASTGKKRGLCADCFEAERMAAMKRLRIKHIRARRARRNA